MIARDQIEKILKINGVAPTSPDEQIRSVLLSARYNADEVDTALMVLREDTRTRQTKVDGLHKVFRTSEALQPSEVSALLGIDISIDTSIDQRQMVRRLSTIQVMIVWLMSVAVAVSGILFYMYMQKVGVFHPSVYTSSQ